MGVRVATIDARKPLCLPPALPARCAIHGAGELCRVAEGFSDKHPVTICVLPVITQTPGHPRKEVRGKVGKEPGFRHDQKPGVVGHHIEPLELLLWLPAHPSVAGGALEGAVLPCRQAKSEVLITHDVAQTAPRQTLKAEIVGGGVSINVSQSGRSCGEAK